MERHRFREAIVACVSIVMALVFGVATMQSPAAVAAAPSSVQTLIDAGVATDGTDPHYTGPDRFSCLPSDTIVFWSDGTGGGHNPVVAGPITGARQTLVNIYPQSKWPTSAGNTSSGLTAPTWNESRDLGAKNVAAALAALQADSSVGTIVLSGFSQGGDVTLAGLELAVAQGVNIDEHVVVYVIADPRNPWGEWQGRAQEPFGKLRATVLGTPDSARNPADTGSVAVTSVIVTGDTIANRQYVWYRPVSSAIVNWAGGIAHGNPDTNGNLDQYGAPTVFKSAEGNTTYLVYQSRHPVTLVAKQALGYLGVTLSETQIGHIDRLAEVWYPIQTPTVENAAVPVYEVTTPAATAAGMEASDAASFSVPASSAEEPTAELEPSIPSSEKSSVDQGESSEDSAAKPETDDDTPSREESDLGFDSDDTTDVSESSDADSNTDDSSSSADSDISDSSDGSSDD